MPVTTWFLVLAAVLALLFVAARRRLQRVPTAYAWDPNSHDKIVKHAVDLLADDPAGKKKTLIGWALDEVRQQVRQPNGTAGFFLTNMESQIRRGSVEEDMNSAILVHVLYDWLKQDCLEGSNGGYHFYTPGNQKGLTDCSFLPKTFGQIGSGCQPPMPSAYDRATKESPCGLDPGGRSPAAKYVSLALRLASVAGLVGRAVSLIGEVAYYAYQASAFSEWHMDEEGRNYSFSDSKRYSDFGYSHLAFYTIGRIAHLLSDMAVPAHVRNDSHAGTAMQKWGFDPSDPLEVFAERQDMRAAGIDPYSKNPLDSDGKHVYAYNPRRNYPKELPSDPDLDAFRCGQERWPTVRAASAGETDGLFHRLASETSSKYYSFNTIPGNLDSHPPEDVNAQLPLGPTVDWSKCDVETDIVGPLLELLCWEASRFLNPGFFPLLIEATGRDQAYFQAEADAARTLEQRVRAESKPLKAEQDQIIGISPRLGVPTLPLVTTVLKKLPEWFRHAALAKASSNRIEGDTVDLSPKGEAIRAAHGFVEKVDKLKLQLQVLLEKAEQAPGSSTVEVLRKWVDDRSHLDEAVLREFFTVQTREWQVQGPFCLTEKIIKKAYVDRQGAAMAHCAAMFSNWFESLYTAMGRPRGLGVWQNKRPADATAPPSVDSIRLLNDATDVASAEGTALLGVANHFPMPLAVTIDIELTDDSDPNILESGVMIDLDWRHLLPEVWFGPHGDLTYEPGMGLESDHLAHTDTPTDQELAAYLKAFGDGPGPMYSPSKPVSVTLGGKDSAGQDIPKTKRVELDGAMPPFNLQALARVQLPPGEWAPNARRMGGMMRDKEADVIFSNRIPAWPDEASGLDRMTASFLQVAVGFSAEAAATPAPTSEGKCIRACIRRQRREHGTLSSGRGPGARTSADTPTGPGRRDRVSPS